MKTVLNDELLGWFDFPDNQLWNLVFQVNM